MPSSIPPLAALLMAAATWGSLFFVAKPLLEAIDAVWFTAIRYALATSCLFALLALRKRTPWQELARHAPRLAVLGFLGYGFFSAMVFAGLARSVPSHGAVVMATMPVTTMLVRWAQDRAVPSARSLLLALLALVGVATVSGALTHAPGAVSTLAGDALALAGTIGWVLYTRGGAALPKLSALEYTGFTAVASLPLLLLAAALATLAHVAQLPDLAFVAHVSPRLLYIAIVPTVAAALAFNFGVRRMGALTGTLFINAVPVSALAFAAATGVRPAANEFAGVALVVMALMAHVLLSATPGRKVLKA